MPPRYAYWTILIDGKPTAFRARERDELMPTFNQLARKNADIVMRYFARGKLWDSPEQADWANKNAQAPRERRDGDWRPGGTHEDPRARFDKRRDSKKRPFSGPRERREDVPPATTAGAPKAFGKRPPFRRDGFKPAGAGSSPTRPDTRNPGDAGSARGRDGAFSRGRPDTNPAKAGSAQGDRRPRDARRPDDNQQKPWSDRPPQKPRSDRPPQKWSDRPPQKPWSDRPQQKPWTNRPRGKDSGPDQGRGVPERKGPPGRGDSPERKDSRERPPSGSVSGRGPSDRPRWPRPDRPNPHRKDGHKRR